MRRAWSSSPFDRDLDDLAAIHGEIAWITCPRCEGQTYDVGACGLCGNLGVLDENGDRFHCDCRADDWVEGDNNAIRCGQCGGYAGEPGTSIRLRGVDD